MDFFDKLSKKATEAFEITKEKTSQLSKEVQLRNKIYRNNNKIEEMYEEIGEIVYTANKKGMKLPEDKIQVKIKDIDKLVSENDKAGKEILELRNSKLCVECGKAMSADDEYCAKCGAKQPKVVKKAAPAAKKPAAKKVPVKKTAAKKTTTKAAAKKAPVKKVAAKKPAAKKAPAKKTTTKKK